MKSIRVKEGHPTNVLYITMDGEVTSGQMDAFELWLARVGDERDWVLQPPELIDYVDEFPSGGHSNHTFGCGLRMFSALPPWGNSLPKDVDRRHLEETEFLVDELSALSESLGCSFRLQLDRTPVGMIENGKSDDGISLGLLGEWRKAISDGT